MKKHTVDMTNGSILRHIIAFAIPIMIAGVLQTLYNAADTIVVGKFAGDRALAAVGSTGSAINLMLNIFVGLSSATNVIVARKFGAGNKSGVSKAVHTSIAVCITGGVFLAVMGILFCKKILILMGSPDDVIDLATLYMRIYFAGIPAGIQGSLFSLSNVIIQSSVNSCGSDVIAGNSAAASIEGMVYIAMNSFFHAILTFTGQNLGAHRFDRIKKGFWTTFCISMIFGIILSQSVVLLSPVLLRLYTNSDVVMRFGEMRMGIICATYFLCGLMEVTTGSLRGLGVANRAMFTSLVGVCGVRFLMTYLGAPYKEASDLKFLFYSYPISWILTGGILMIFFFAIVKSREKKWHVHLENRKGV